VIDISLRQPMRSVNFARLVQQRVDLRDERRAPFFCRDAITTAEGAG
jgi:hypothetical protein